MIDTDESVHCELFSPLLAFPKAVGVAVGVAAS